MLAALSLTPCLDGQPASIGCEHCLVVLLHLVGDVGGKDRLQPLSGAAADDPSVRGGYRASKASGELRSSKGKAFVPGHGKILPRKIKFAMRKIKACDPIRNAYSLRMSAQQYAEAVIATALHNGMTIEQIAKMDPKELAQAHLHTQNKATDAAAKQILAQLK
jgi:hypothetical protein